MSQNTNTEGSAQPVWTSAQTVAYISAVFFRLAAPAVARDACLAALKELGLSTEATVQAVHHAESEALRMVAGPSNTKRKKGADSGAAEADGKKRSKRGLSAVNLFMVYLFDCVNKDQSNPAFKVPSTTDADGKVTQVRGGSMQLGAHCWKSMSETDKARFLEIAAPFLKDNQAVAGSERSKGQLVAELQAYLTSAGLHKEVHQLVFRAVKAATGINPSNPAAAPAASAPPAAQAPHHLTNGTATQGKTVGSQKPAPVSSAANMTVEESGEESDEEDEGEDYEEGDEEEEGEEEDLAL